MGEAMKTSGFGFKPEVTPSASSLADPVTFAAWWRDKVDQRKIPPIQIAETLERSGTAIGLVRASQVLTRDPAHAPLAAHLAGRALSAGDVDVRLLARLRLATLEVMRGYRLGARDARGAFSAIPLLHDLLGACDEAQPRSDLIVEVEMRCHKSLGEALLMTGAYPLAHKHLAHALAIAEGFGLESFAHHVLFLLGVVCFHDGQLTEATATLERVAMDVRAEIVYAHDASLMIAMTLLSRGDDLRAISALEALRTNSEVYALYADCALVITGRGGLGASPDRAAEVFANELLLTFRAYRLLLQANGRRRSRESDDRYRALRAVLEGFRTTTPWLEAERGLLRCLASLRLGEFGLAAQQYPMFEVQSEHVALRALVLGLGLEIGLHYLGTDVRPLAGLTAKLQRLLLEVSLPVRQSLAQRFKVFLPLAGSFLALSPHSVPEFVSVCGPAVLNMRVKPVAVYGTATLRPVHAVRHTLEAFGHPEVEHHSGGGQLEAEESALCHLHGSRRHWFTPIPPALLTYQFLRQHELIAGANSRTPSVWLQSALDLSQMYGLLPSGARGFLERERRVLEDAFKSLMRSESSIAEFQTRLRSAF
jgi:hypothetical protein